MKLHLVILAAASLLLPSAAPALAGEARTALTPKIPSAQQFFDPGQVRLLEGPFKTMQDTDLAYLVRLEPDRFLAQFRVEAGLEPKAKPYGGWESPAQPGKTWSLAGHSLGHYLSAISWMYRMTGDERLKERVAYICKELKECQDKRGDGSLVAFPYSRELEADIRAGKVETIDKYWAPFYTIHKEMAGLRDAWFYCGDPTAKEILIRFADWCGSVIQSIPEERQQRMLNMEHGGMPEVLADVYAITGDAIYLQYAKLYSHKEVLDPLSEGKDNLTGKHANTQVPKFIGFQRIHELSGDPKFGAAASNFWYYVIKDRTWVTGGNSIHEHFPDPKDMGRLITDEGGPETCNTYNMIRLTAALYRETPAPAYVDYYEHALFNHILGSQAPLVGAGAFVYYTPLRPDYGRAYGTDFRSFWCCTGTGMENHARYGEFIYSHTARDLTVNLFLASTLDWPERGLALRQETRFPEQDSTILVITRAPADELTVRLRHPAWLASKTLAIKINDKPVTAASQPGGYAVLTRKWHAGDRITVELPMSVRTVRMPQSTNYVSLFYGPILLAGELGADGLTQSDFVGLYTPIKALMPLSKAPVFVAANDKEIVAKIQPVPGQPARFQTVGLTKPADVTLAPFYGVHFQRYSVYWQVSSAQDWEKRSQEIARAEREERELDARTADRIRVGEQQPEIDHNLKFEKSNTGTGTQGRRWREAKDGGWFSYELKLPSGGVPAAVRALYWGRDGGREFVIEVDGKPIATAKLEGNKDDYYGVEYPIPAELTAGKDKVLVRFVSGEGKTAGGVYDVRTVKTK